MSKLVNSNRNKKNLNRGTSITPENTFQLNEHSENKIEKNTLATTYTPKATSMKIDSEIRDKINALSLIGIGDNQKEVVNRALSSFLETLTEDQQRTFYNQFEVLRKRTIDRES